MKKLTAILLASALAFPAAASARPADNDRSTVTRTVVTATSGKHDNRRGQNVRVAERTKAQTSRQRAATTQRVATGQRFTTGQRFDRNRATSYQVVDYRVNQRQLRRPPNGYTWVRSGRDVYLIKKSDRRIARIVRGIFR